MEGGLTWENVLWLPETGEPPPARVLGYVRTSHQ